MNGSMDGRLPGGRLLEGRTALVMSGTSGIGHGIAEVSRERGAAVAVTGLTDIECEEAHAAGFLAYPLDMRDRQACDEAVVRAASNLGGLSVSTSNAGVYPQVRIADMVDEDTFVILGVSAIGTIHMVQAAAATLRESGRERAVVTSSITDNITGCPSWSHYGATRVAQTDFARSAAMELTKDGITIDAIMPGNVVTLGLIALGKEYMRRAATAAPLGCLDEPRDIGETVTFLASDGARYITGQTTVVDGGQILLESSEVIADI